MWQALIGPVVNLIQGHQERKARKAELESALHTKKLEAIQTRDAAEYAADQSRADSLANSWKDEYITLVVSIPVIMCFIPSLAQYVKAGFDALSATPEWYQWLLIAVFSVGAGVPLAKRTVDTIAKIRGS